VRVFGFCLYWIMYGIDCAVWWWVEERGRQ